MPRHKYGKPQRPTKSDYSARLTKALRDVARELNEIADLTDAGAEIDFPNLSTYGVEAYGAVYELLLTDQIIPDIYGSASPASRTRARSSIRRQAG